MSEPYNPPPPPMPPAPPVPPAADPRRSVQGPAIGLIAVAVLGGLLAIVSLTGSSAVDSAAVTNFFAEMMPEEQRSEFTAQMANYSSPESGALNTVSTLFSIAVCGLIGFAGFQMKNLKNRTLAMVACVLAMIPCFSVGCCCIIGIPIGIWGLVVLNKPEVRAAFT